MTPSPMPPARLLTCNGCGDDVEVLGAVSDIDPAHYTCVQCLDPRHRPTLTLVPDPPTRREERERYDPRDAQIPF